jgi:hypothetical protein
MWTSLTMLAALGLPAQTGELELTNIRTTYGFLGPTRPDQAFLPGDQVFIVFDIDNIHTDDTGKILYSIGMEVVDGKGKLVYKRDPADLEGTNSLGGHRLPAFANLDIGGDMPAGQYTLRVAVTDRAAKKTQSFERRFDVLPKSFGFVRLRLTSDPDGKYSVPAFGATGEPVWINLAAAGFELTGPKKEPDVYLEIQILDERDKTPVVKPQGGDIKSLPTGGSDRVLPIWWPLVLNRPGKFLIKIKGTDRVSKKSSEISFPIEVFEPK